ncbi:MAG: sugar phosphate nucleotidyltransferase [Chthoniobacterales bacterium]|nr:sugar phosphate nucleotidyltransferase [Chthoniobacterales bacterium]
MTTNSVDRLHVFIMAGGSGERFWPASRTATPKHLLKLLGDQTLLEQTVRRFEGIIPFDRIFILTNVAQIEATLAAVPFLPTDNIIAEPAKRDTAPAAALATGIARSRNSDAIVGLFPADAMIHDTAAFRRQLTEATEFVAGNPSILTFSITPTHASTGFGYLQLGKPIAAPGSTHIVCVERFVEKPDADRAQEFLQGKKHGWNAGMFLWQAETFLDECRKQHPELEQFILGFPNTGALTDYLAEAFPKLPKISVDFAIMEKATSVVAAIAEYDWDDVGSWTALPDHLGKDAQENTLQGRVVTLDAGRNIVVAGKRTIALCGVSDLVVVETDDAVLVCHRNAVQQIKNLPLPPELK